MTIDRTGFAAKRWPVPACAAVFAGLMLPAAALASEAGEGVEAADPTIIVTALLADRIETIGGAVSVIDAQTIDQMVPISIKDMLRRAPGVHIVDEDALGLRLNISVRGLDPRRSARSLLLEDGAPIQPAPYADPSAHYAPPNERIERIEVRKGSGQILFGPQTIGGMFNFITPPPPASLQVTGSVSGGSRGYVNANASLGFGNESGGIRLDMIAKRASGTRRGHSSRVGDVALSARRALGADHVVRLKLGYFTEDSRITESGLTAARFAADPFANPFANDRFELSRLSAQIIDEWRIGPALTLTTQAYYADMARTSYRQTDDATDTMIANPATGCVGAARVDYEGFASRCGNKMRPRTFTFWGIEPRLELRHALFGPGSRLILGARLHDEDTRRKRFNGLTPTSRETSAGSVLRDDNAIDTRALAAYAENLLAIGTVTLAQGVRVERIVTTNRSNVANFAVTGVESQTRQTIVLPGAGVTWNPTPAITVFGGVHRGFAPPRPDRDINPLAPFSPVRPERSVEFEAGFRAVPLAGLSLAATAYALDISDLIVEGPLVGGRSGTFVNAGSAAHRGLETSARFERGGWYLLATHSWLITARFTGDVDLTEASVRGNRLPYAPRHMLTAAIGHDAASGGGFEFGFTHIGQQFANSSNDVAASADGNTGLIPANTIFRAAAHYQRPGSRWRWFASAENLFDRVYISSRVDGLFAGPRAQAIAGVRIAL